MSLSLKNRLVREASGVLVCLHMLKGMTTASNRSGLNQSESMTTSGVRLL